MRYSLGKTMLYLTKCGSRLNILAVIALLIFFPFRLANAHKVILFAYVAGDTIHTESYFSGGRKAQNSLIEVFNNNGKKLLKGRTDKNGQFSFPVPEKADITIVLNASMGHRAEFKIPAAEIPPRDAIRNEKKPQNIVREPQAVVADKNHPDNTAGKYELEPDDVRAIVNEALDQRLKPVMDAIIDALPRGPSVTEVIGGIGYIFGLFGVYMYFMARKEHHRK